MRNKKIFFQDVFFGIGIAIFLLAGSYFIEEKIFDFSDLKLTSSLSPQKFSHPISSSTSSHSSLNNLSKNKNPKIKILFVGDIMLDRGVESLMKEKGYFYPFEEIANFLSQFDMVIGNLEGVIVKTPPDFKAHSLRFAFAPETAQILKKANFRLLSLANNHTSDLGEVALNETKSLLTKQSIQFVGDPVNCDKDYWVKMEEIIVLAFNKTFSFNCDNQSIVKLTQIIRKKFPQQFLIVFLHWGEEYQLISSSSQRKLAHSLIDAGADLIIGSHPHVVQEIEKYKGKLIFYSLGNFIFDQYFSRETQRGLAVSLELYPSKIIYKLYPYTLFHSQPKLMNEKEREWFLNNLAEKSSADLRSQIKNGIIEIEF